MNERVVGRCSECGGAVTVPEIWHGVNRPPQTCSECGAIADTAAHLPVIPMRRQRPRKTIRWCPPI